MTIEPNERLLYEAFARRKAIAEGQKSGGVTRKGVREMAAMFAIRDSIQRGEQPGAVGLDPLCQSGAIADLVEKVIPPSMKGEDENEY